MMRSPNGQVGVPRQQYRERKCRRERKCKREKVNSEPQVWFVAFKRDLSFSFSF